MVFTINVILRLAASLLLFFSHSVAAELYSGLATRDQNPLLIPYWIPHTVAATGKSGVQISTSFFISNTLHDEAKNNERLIIDSETYRFDLNLQYEIADWVYHVQIPVIASNGGFMDDVIIKWHNALSLPQGNRLNYNSDKINIQYQTNNEMLIDTQQAYSGIGDISLSSIRPFYSDEDMTWTLGLGLNIPSGNNNVLISNQRVDGSIWLSYFSENKPIFLTLGIIKHGNSGYLKNRLRSSVIFVQSGLEIPVSAYFDAQLQLDYHSKFINSNTDALGQSLQVQFGINIIQGMLKNLQLFFSEDILVGSAPDITFGLQLDWRL